MIAYGERNCPPINKLGLVSVSLNNMDIQKIQQYKSAFDLIAKDIKDDEGNTIEVWYARELQQVLGYARWENFVVAVGRAMESCKTLGINVDDHFREVTKMIALAKGAQREVLLKRWNGV